MDDLDHEIIEDLIEKGYRKSIALADIFNVGERTIRRRVNNMLQNGIIKVIAIPNPVALGFKGWSRIGIKVIPGAIKNVTRLLIDHPSVDFMAYALGRFDIIISVHFENIDEITHFVNSYLAGIKGILFTETWMLVSPRKYYHFLWPETVIKNNNSATKDSRNINIGNNQYEVDDVDRRILNLLRKNGLASPKHIKITLGIGEASTRKRKKRMLHEDVYKLEIIPDSTILESDTLATIGITVNHEFTNKFMDSVTKFPNVYLASESLGRFNIILCVRFRNANLLTHFITTDLSSIEGINYIETYMHNKPLKYHNIRCLDNLSNPI